MKHCPQCRQVLPDECWCPDVDESDEQDERGEDETPLGSRP